MTLIDTHCHLAAAEFDADRQAIVVAAQKAGVAALVVPAVDRASFPAVSACCAHYPVCVAAYGIHPLFVDTATDDDLVFLREQLQRRSPIEPIAVGEIGLDRFVANLDVVKQERLFVEQLRLARAAGLPVLLHVRRAIDEVLRNLRQVRVCGGIAHAFSGSRQQADEFIKLGFKLGFGGAMTHPRATRIRALAAALPLTSLVLETDAPDMAPAWLAGGRNTPDQLPAINTTLADLRQIEAAELAGQTTANALAVLPELRLPD